MAVPVSCYIRAKNEERQIADVVRAALQVAAEVVVVDSGSTDATIACAEAAGARVVAASWRGWGKQKRIGEDACTHDWLLDIDADEIVTAELAAEIAGLFANGGQPRYPIYQMSLATVPPVGKPWMDFNLVKRNRFYDRRVVRAPDHAMADQFEVPAGVRIGRLRAILLHRSFNDLAHLAEKFNRHSSASARDNKLKPFWWVALRFLLAPPFYFFTHYVMRGLWRGGWYGFAVAVIAAHGRWLKDAKMMELHLRKRQGV
jgi:glycosyltransferase involved in cell wall biosynthesis